MRTTTEIAESLGGKFEYVKEPQALVLVIGDKRFEFKPEKRLPYNELLAAGIPNLTAQARAQ